MKENGLIWARRMFYGKRFNTTGLCLADRHYMADMTTRVEEVHSLIADGKVIVEAVV